MEDLPESEGGKISANDETDILSDDRESPRAGKRFLRLFTRRNVIVLTAVAALLIVAVVVSSLAGRDETIRDAATDAAGQDNDGDGSAEESGIDPRPSDTDGDGLPDADESEVWGTDPVLSDTDGDGYDDGDEVVNGYDPLGPGRMGENGSDGKITGSWLSGVCDDIGVYSMDLDDDKQWRSVEGECVQPHCEERSGTRGGTTIALTDDDGVDFSMYPAQNGCRAVGGRLPDRNELICINEHRASFGTLQSGFYWSDSELGDMDARTFSFDNGSDGDSAKTDVRHVRCVRDE